MTNRVTAVSFLTFKFEIRLFTALTLDFCVL